MDFRDVRRLTYFVAVAEELHFGRAAARLGMAQPPLSQQIQDLEARLQVKLFERNRRAVTLTPTGELLLREARRVLSDIERLQVIARRAKDGMRNVLRIGCITSALFDPLPRLLAAAKERDPEFEVLIREVNTAHAQDMLRRREIDIALIRIMRTEKDLTVLPLTSDHLVAAVPHRHRLARERQIHITRLADEEMIFASRHVNPELYDAIISGCIRNGFSPLIKHEAVSIISQIGFVACGLGVAIVPKTSSRLRVGNVKFIELDEQIRINEISLVFRNDPGSERLKNLLI
ncbi:LysR family transcriptional regulator [Rhodoligotrophos defluvii]|uniref:LysR family transcriptional regulator n=1 Tax=Rhodoligotrophos defluvii TaxID=2561934 RepID=UPI0010C95931|nr:LysR substrate-binding domain-containing protein [Rhodoligotrophos defluvii]